MSRTHERRACLRCGVDMHVGVVIERDQNNLYRPVKWYEGIPDYRGFFGGYSIKTSKDSRILEVYTFRCPDCGMLESVAVDDGELALLEGDQSGELSLAEGGSAGGLTPK